VPLDFVLLARCRLMLQVPDLAGLRAGSPVSLMPVGQQFPQQVGGPGENAEQRNWSELA
jgi:hypothetical protein